MRISREVARRFLLGRQGLWPGRRWRGLAGTERAMRAMEHVQLDPLRVVARAQDLALHGRVLDYHEDDWARLTYEQRRFFEWGGWLAVRPIEELPYYRVLMRRSVDSKWIRPILEQHGPVVAEMRRLLHERGEVSNRDFAVVDRNRVNSYRGRKDSSLALHYLWRVGEAMVTRRERFERVYAPAEAVVPARYLEPASEQAADDFLLLKGVANVGFSRLNGAAGTLHRPMPAREIAAWRDRMLAAGTLIEVEIEDLRGRHVVLARDASDLETLAAGRTPRGWKPLEATTTDEVTFLSPLDPVIGDRARTRALFDFDYKWEVYDKPEKRRFGYYVLPVLWGDRLVARIDAKVDRAPGSATLRVLELWHEAGPAGRERDLASALEAGLRRLAVLVGAEHVVTAFAAFRLGRSRRTPQP